MPRGRTGKKELTKRLKKTWETAIHSPLLHAIVNGITDPVFIKDLEGRYVVINEAGAQWVGKSLGEIVGKTARDIFPAKQVHIILKHEEELLLSGVPQTFEETEMANGSLRHFVVTKTIYRDEKGRALGLIGIIRDTTTQKEEQITRDNFLAMLAHELRNPLAPVLNTLQIIGHRGVQDAGLKNHFALIERQVKNMTRLLNDLLDASRLARGKIELHREKISLGYVIQRSVETVRHFLESRNHVLITALPAQHIGLFTDPVRIEQVLVNLLSNAIKFTPRGGKILISAEVESREVVIRIRDTGAGIDSEMLPKIFDLFFQADQSLARTERGLGVGLTIVRTLVEMHGGKVEVLSEGENRGSEFIVRIPAILETEKKKQDQTPDILCTRELGKKKILVVDDNHDAARSLGELLTLWGHEVKIVNEAVAVLAAVPLFKPDVVLLDIGLPEMNGYEVAQKLRSNIEFPLLLVAVTGYGQKKDKQKSAEAGFDHHLTKPINFDILREVLNA